MALIACSAPCAGDSNCILATCAEEIAASGGTGPATAVGTLMATLCADPCMADAGVAGPPDAGVDAGP